LIELPLRANELNDDVEEVCKDVDVVKEVNLKLIVAALQAMSRTSTDEISALPGKFCSSQKNHASLCRAEV
jgi:hypothetical protein